MNAIFSKPKVPNLTPVVPDFANIQKDTRLDERRRASAMSSASTKSGFNLLGGMNTLGMSQLIKKNTIGS